MELCINILNEALAISHAEVKAIEERDLYKAEELLNKREDLVKQLGHIGIEDKLLFYKKLQELQTMQVKIIDMSQKLRHEYVGELQRSNKESTRLSAYKKIIGQALASAH